MECALESHDFTAARVERGEFHRILVGFGPRVAKEQLIVVFAADGTQLLGQLLLACYNDRVGIESELVELVCHRLDVIGIGVADRYYGMTAVHVQIARSLVVPHPRAFALCYGNVVYGVNVEHFHSLIPP